MFPLSSHIDEIDNSELFNHGEENTQTAGGELKLINEGTYGCIYHPGINCQGKKENVNYLTKIMKSTKTIQNEIAISSIIKTIKGYTRHFAPIVKQCPVKIAKQYVDEVKQCGVFEGESDNAILSNTYYSNKIRYVGDTNISKHILSQSSVRSFWKELLETHTYLLKGVQKLLSKNIIHHDVKYNNIMYDAKLGNPVFIDFGISIHLPSTNASNLHHAFYVFDTYPYWCFEVCVNNYIFREITYQKAQTAKITKAELDKIVDVFIYGYDKKYNSDNSPQIQNDIFASRALPMDSEHLISHFKQRIHKYYSGFIGQTWFALYSHFIEEKVFEGWDGYSLAVVYLFIMDDYIKHQYDTYQDILSKTPTQYREYVKLLHTIIFSSPNDRPSPQAIIKSIKQIMNSVSRAA